MNIREIAGKKRAVKGYDLRLKKIFYSGDFI